MKPHPVDAQYARERLSYDPHLGIFLWNDHADLGKLRGARAGKQAGWVSQGYRVIGISRDGIWRSYKANRIAWLLMTGEWPRDQIDHRDMDRLNDRWTNLRLATAAENKRNRRAYRNNRLGIKGVHRHSDGPRPFRARIRLDGTVYHLGCFETVKEASAAYADAAKRLHAEFARSS